MPIEKWLRISKRLRQMKQDELLDRTRQALAKRSDAAVSWLGLDFARNSQGQGPSAPGNFFFAADSVDSILAMIRQRLPGRAEQIIQEAEQIRQHRFDLLGYAGLDYGNPNGLGIDWHLDAVHGKRSPKKAFHRIRYLDYSECGDSKVIWELNRHQHLVTLAKAYRLTNDLRYFDEILRQRRHWQAENPYPVGINWASSLEVAFRSLSWIWTYYLLLGARDVPGIQNEWLRGLALHGRHIERYLSTYFSPNTHLLGEGVALFFLGILCPELARAERWKSLGWEIVLQESERQVLGDGFHCEQSTYYHVYALDFFLHATVLATLNNIPVPKRFEDRVEKMLTGLYLLGRNGPPPQFGDDDGGRLFDPHRNRPEHFLDPLATGSVLFRRGDFKTAAGALCEESLWLLGDEGVRRWDRLEAAPVSHESAALPEAGHYMLTTEDTQLFVHAGPPGAHSAGHSHADALSICLNSHGHPLLIDSGTSEYVGPGGDRDLFRATAMHNTLRVDGLNQAETMSTFSWRSLPHSRVEQWVKGQSFDLFVASHNGYQRSNRQRSKQQRSKRQRFEQPVTHRRWVVSLKNGVYLVRDVVEGSGTHRVDIAWHLAQDLEFVEAGVFRVRGARRGLSFVPASGSVWTEELREEMCSARYGSQAPTAVLNFAAETMLPAEFCILLVTPGEIPHSSGSFRRIEQLSQSNVSAYEYAAGDGEYSFFFSERGTAWDSGLLSSDAKYVCHRRGPGDYDERLMLCDGSYAKVDRGPGMRSNHAVAWAELILNETGPTIFSSDGSAILDRSASGQTAPNPASAISGKK
jgi:hypothetical protein